MATFNMAQVQLDDSTISNVYQFVSVQFDNELASVIEDYRAAEAVEQDQWNKTAQACIDAGCDSKESWVEHYSKAEQNNVSTRIAGGEVIEHYTREEMKANPLLVSRMTAKGEIIAKQCFSATWNTDKAIIGKALENGVPLFDVTGTIKPKTALQTEYKAEIEGTKVEKTAAAKMLSVINTYGALYAQLSDAEKIDARHMIANVHTNAAS